MVPENKRTQNENETENDMPDKTSGKKPNTSTSRLKITKPQSGEDSEAAKETQQKPQQDTTQKGDDTVVTDPMALRDTNTSKVRRVSGGKGAPEATAVVPGSADSEDEAHKTETVQLKVVQEKKKQLADMMNPASTVRLRAPGGKRGKTQTPATATAGQDTSAEPATPEKKDESGTGEDKKTESKQQGSPPSPQGKTSTQTLKKMSPQGKEGAKPSSPDKTVKTSGQSSAKSKPGSTQAGGRTLKIKGKGTGGTASRTVKTGPAKTGKRSDQTVKVSAPVSDKTTKVATDQTDKTVKTGQAPGLRLQEKKQPTPEKTEAAAQAAMATQPQEEPGIGTTLAATAAFVASGVLLYFVIEQAITHIW